MNNYEKIKNMSIDEIAEVFNRKFCEECQVGFYSDEDNWNKCYEKCWANPKNEYYKHWLESEIL